MYFASTGAGSASKPAIVGPDGSIIAVATSPENATAIVEAMNAHAAESDAEAELVEDRQPGVWTYSFPNCGRGTITIYRAEELEHREIEDLLLRYGATECAITPPGAEFVSASS